MELGHLLTRSGLTHPEVSSKVYYDCFCQLGSSISLPCVTYFEAFYLHVVSGFSCIPVICPKLVLFLTPLQFVSRKEAGQIFFKRQHGYGKGIMMHLLVVYPVLTNEEMTTESQRYNCFIRNGGDTVPKHASPEAKVSNSTTGPTLLWARNPFRGNFNHWQVSRKEAGQIFFKRQDGCGKVS